MILAITAVYTVLGKFHRTSLIHLYICTFLVHLYFISLSSVLHLDIGYNWFVRHSYVFCTSFVLHLYFTGTSFVLHLYVICTSFVLPLNVICTFPVLHLFFIVEWFICTSFVLHKYSRTLLYGHPLNTDVSLLRTVFPVPGESRPSQFRAPVRVKFWQATWAWNSEISLDEMATKDIKKG